MQVTGNNRTRNKILSIRLSPGGFYFYEQTVDLEGVDRKYISRIHKQRLLRSHSAGTDPGTLEQTILKYRARYATRSVCIETNKTVHVPQELLGEDNAPDYLNLHGITRSENDTCLICGPVKGISAILVCSSNNSLLTGLVEPSFILSATQQLLLWECPGNRDIIKCSICDNLLSVVVTSKYGQVKMLDTIRYNSHADVIYYLSRVPGVLNLKEPQYYLDQNSFSVEKKYLKKNLPGKICEL